MKTEIEVNEELNKLKENRRNLDTNSKWYGEQDDKLSKKIETLEWVLL